MDAPVVREGSGAEAKAEAEDVVRVVAVDDKTQLLDLYRMMFERTRFHLVGQAGDGRGGVDAALSKRADLVLMDLSMPDMDGLEAIMELRRRRSSAHVVVMTGFGRDRLGSLAADLGASGFIEKGTRPAEVLAELERIVSRPPPRFVEPGEALLARVRELL